MYSVVRFISGDKDLLMQTGDEINSLGPAVFTGLDSIGGRFSISISEAEEIVCQMREIKDFIKRFSSIIQRARSLGVRIEVDMACEIEDFYGDLYGEIKLDKVLIDLLSKLEVEFCVTIYRQLSSL